MVEMKCAHCGFVVSLATEQLATLVCQHCGCAVVVFARDVACHTPSGRHDDVKAGKDFNSTYWTGVIISNVWSVHVKETKDKQVASAKISAPTRKPARRGRPKTK